MMKKYALIFLAFLGFSLFGYGQVTLSEWALTDHGNPNNVAANVTAGDFFGGTGIGEITYSTTGAYSNGWSTGSINLNDYYQISISPNTGYDLNIEEILFGERRSGTGIRNYQVRWSTDNFSTFSTIATMEVPDNTSERSGDITGLSIDVNDGETILIRFYGYNAEAGGGTWRINDDTLALIGTITSSCPSPANPNGTITGTTPACSNTTLTYTGTDTTPLVSLNYWQTSPTGTDTSNEATSPYNATTSGTYYVRKYDVVADCWSTGTVSHTVVVEAASPTLSQPTNQNETIPDTATFTVNSSDTDTYQWQVSTDSGTTWNNVTTGTGGTTDSYTTEATSAGMNGNQYRCILTNICGSTTSNAATLSLSNSSPNNATNLTSCIGDTSISLNWNNATGGATGYIVFAQANSTIPFMAAASAGNADEYIANTNYTLATTYSTLGKVVYKGNTNSTIVTGLTNGADYTFKVVAYNGNTLTGWATGINNTNTSSSYIKTYNIDTPVANITSASIATTSSVISWTNPLPTSCYEILIVANQGNATTFSPTGDGSAYIANSNYSGPDSYVFKGNGTITTVSNLTDGLNYCYTIFVRNKNTNDWSRGNTVCQTTGLSYCDSNGGSSTNSGILNVTLNTINNSSPSNPAYSDFTGTSTTLTLGEQYDLSVHVNTGGNYTSYVKVWIDWNRDGSFNNSNNETIELGTLENNNNGQPSLSPLSITVPANASLGNIRMRVSSKSDSGEDYSTPCETGGFSYGEVEDYTINIVQPNNPEIYVEGGGHSIPGDGSNVPYGLNNTLFASQAIGDSQDKTFNIYNLGALNLNISSIIIGGSHPSDFSITGTAPASTISSGNNEVLQVTFQPTASGVRTATVTIHSNDSDEPAFVFNLQGTATCNAGTYSLSPTTGPPGTIVTVTTTSGSNPNSTTALYDNNTTTINSLTPSSFEITIPTDAISANISFNDVSGCTRYLPFTVIDLENSSCEGTATLPTDIFISEVTDRDSSIDGHSYVELFNGTGAPVNISNYFIEVHSNGGGVNAYINIPNGTTLANNDTYVISFGTGSNNIDPASQNDYFSANTVGINDSDHLILNNGSIDIDLWGDTSGNPFTGGVGTEYNSTTPNGSDYTYRRKNYGITAPSLTWNPSDWTLITPLNYSDIGNFNFSVGTPPTITVQPTLPTTSCNIITSISVEGQEGFDEPSDTKELSYQWYYSAPGDTGWTLITDGALYSGATTETLNILDALSLEDYQFYCQVREDSATCYTASNAVRLHTERTIWTAAGWSSPPSINKIAIIDYDYNTNNGTNGQTSFDACNLIINAGNTLTVGSGDYVNVNFNVTNNGTFHIENNGSLIQVDDAGVNTGNISMLR
ncbi:MAG: GEVED domain-containing protein, partial [Arenibacter latericius]|nr:GEVED domain-containing protein [Arenibacter latericius]